MKLSIVIVSYNVESYLKQCINSIHESKINIDCEIIIIDNHSFDNSCKMILENFPNVKLISNDANLGFSKAANIGIKASKGDFVCVLNPDTLISENVFTILIKYLNENKKIGCIGPKILNADGTLQLACKRSFPTPLISFYKLIGLSTLLPKSKIFGKYNLTYLDKESIHSIDAISGSFMLFRKEVLLKIGLFDEDFFMYGEDLDICYRIKSAGYSIVYNPNASIIHYKGESTRNAPFNMIEVFYLALQKFFLKYKHKYTGWKYMGTAILCAIKIRKLLSYIKVFLPRIIAYSVDLLSIFVSFCFVIYLWYTYYHNIFVDINFIIYHKYLLINIIISWIISSFLMKLYKRDYLNYVKAVITAIISLLIASTTTYLISVIAFSRAVLLLTFINISILSSLWRLGIYILYRYGMVNVNNKTYLFSRRAAIIGANKESMRIGKLLNETPESHFQVIGYIDKKNYSLTNKFLGRIDDILEIVNNNDINELIIPEKFMKINQLINLLNCISLNNVNCKLVPNGEETLIGKGIVENLSGVSLLDIDFPIFDRLYRYTKRFFDILLSMILLLLTSPFSFYYILFNKIEFEYIWTVSNKKLKIYIFKSKFKILSEIPFLINVFVGSLSFVGTQMVSFNDSNPGLIIKPGITGLAHLKSSDIKFESMKKIENYYAMNYSLSFDIEILIKSIFKL